MNLIARVLAAAGAMLLGVVCAVGMGTPRASAGAAGESAGLPGGWYASAPYYRVLDPAAPDLRAAMSATGQRAFVLAFILADGSACAPAWKGTDPVAGDTRVAAVIDRVRAGGGDVSVSAGGYGGTKLGQACPTAAAAAAGYQKVIDAYRLRAFDLDLEEPEIDRPDQIARELGAAKILRRANPGLFLTVTIPLSRTGAAPYGQRLLAAAKRLGFTPDVFTGMPFDAGFTGGGSQVTALRDFHAQLERAFGWSGAQAYAHEGFSGMNGETDKSEYFRQADFRTVLGFARGADLGRCTFWSVNRDRQCDPPGNNGQVSSECSGVPQRPWTFTADTTAFARSR